MSLNTEGIGKPLCEIVDKNNKDAKNKKVVYMSEDYELDKVKNQIFNIELPSSQYFQQIPDVKNKRRILYTSGKSGSGKTYYTAEYVKKYVKQNPKNKVIVFSSLESDKTLDDIKQIKRVKVKTPGFCNEEFKIDQFKDTLVIFDDTDCIQDKNIIRQINNIADIVLQTGRHTNTSMIFTSHLSCAGNATKMILNESHSIIFFPSSMTSHSLKYLCMTYVGLDNKQCKLLQKEKSRWICSFKSCPSVLMTMNKICFASDYGDANMKKSDDSNDDSIIEEPKYKSNDKYLCKTCNVKVLYRNKQRHEQTPKHLKNV